LGRGHVRHPSGALVMYALVDCNNFYASCERLFRPDLQRRPIVVLSNNDGCVIARSNETKALGIKMGEPYFKIKGLCKKHHIHVFSSNYALYGDLSHRVMSVISEAWPSIEIYSIDEAFLDLSTHPSPEDFCAALQRKILKHTGIPTSIGLGETKTLAKLANALAKKELKIPVFYLSPDMPWFDRMPIEDIWGVGRQWSKRLHAVGIHTAADLRKVDPHWLRQQFSVVLQRTAYELAGKACLELEAIVPRQSIQCSRSFGVTQTEYSVLSQAISHHCARAFEILRAQKLRAQHVSVFINSNRFRTDKPQYHPSIDVALAYPTDDLMKLTKAALSCLHKIYKPGIDYQKSGIMLTNLSGNTLQQLDLFHNQEGELATQKEQLMQLVDQVNARFGRQHLHLASDGSEKRYAMKSGMKSPRYTTTWSELRQVKTHSY
jgi:DNA polymerase V